MQLRREKNYSISYDVSVPENADVIILAMHGFAGDRKSSCIKLLEERANAEGMGLIKFDWPCHGESEAGDNALTVKNCLADLDSIVTYTKSKFPGIRNTVAFSTSFGGYLTLLYNYYSKDVFTHIILRSPAIKMYDILMNKLLNDAAKAKLAENKEVSFGFERLLKISAPFAEEIKNNDIIKLYGDTELKSVSIIHGTCDDIVPFYDSSEFSELHKCSLYPVLGADHRYKKSGELDAVISAALAVLCDIIKNKEKNN